MVLRTQYAIFLHIITISYIIFHTHKKTVDTIKTNVWGIKNSMLCPLMPELHLQNTLPYVHK